MPRHDAPARRRLFLLVYLGVLLANSAFLAVANRMPDPTRQQFTAFFYMGNVLLHLLLGFGCFVILLKIGKAWTRAIRESAAAGKLLGLLSRVALAVCLLAGLALLIVGNLRPQQWILSTHGIAAVVAALAAAIWLAATKAESPEPSLTRSPAHPLTRSALRPAAILIAAVVLPAFLLMGAASHITDSEAKVVNGAAPTSMDGEGDGPNGRFFPASVQSVDNRFFPPEYFTDNKSCGEAGCHPDIYKQWYSSAHHFGSFNNQWYRKSIEYMQEVVGTKPSKWCGGCHDMAILLTEMPGTGKSRMDFPIKDQIWPPEKHPEAHSGIGCAACHSMVHVKSTMGNNDYLADYPPMHQFVNTRNPLMKAVVKYLTYLAPDPHRKTFLKPFHTQDTARFCSSCHKVHLDVPVNHFKWFRGFDEYDAWQGSGVSGFGAKSFYYPNKDGKPNFQKCADCHMPLTKSGDAGNLSGFVHSHRFVAANTALPYVNHDKEQLELTQKFLQDGALSIDIFALRRPNDGTQPQRHRGTEEARRGISGLSHSGLRALGVSAVRSPLRPNAQRPTPEGSESSLFGEAATSGGTGAIKAVDTGGGNETVVAPLDRGPVAVERGKDALVDVVVRTRKVGHAFPGGTFDAFDIWVELQAKDETGRILFWSGSLEGKDGPVEPSAHKYRVLLVDEHGNEINKRNAWSARVGIYARAIPPGAADTVHYRLHIPRDCGHKITLTAKLNYRKFSWYNTQFAFRGRPEMAGNPNYSRNGFIDGTALGAKTDSGPVTRDYDDRPMHFDGSMAVDATDDRSRVPDLPITVLCSNTVTLDAVDGDPSRATAPRKLEPKKDRERWNDYGIGLMLQGDFRRATKAFDQVSRISPDWPEGYVNIGRVRLLEGDLDSAQAMFEKALGMYDSGVKTVPATMIPYLRARTQFFYGTVLQNRGQYDKALAVWTDAARIFPQDKDLHDLLGRTYFLQAKFDDAIGQFNQALAIEPEDLTAHYNLMLCYRGKGAGFEKQMEMHRSCYYRFKAEETKTHLAGPYRTKHPFDNLESQPIHEHGSGPLPSSHHVQVARKS